MAPDLRAEAIAAVRLIATAPSPASIATRITNGPSNGISLRIAIRTSPITSDPTSAAPRAPMRPPSHRPNAIDATTVPSAFSTSHPTPTAAPIHQPPITMPATQSTRAAVGITTNASSPAPMLCSGLRPRSSTARRMNAGNSSSAKSPRMKRPTASRTAPKTLGPDPRRVTCHDTLPFTVAPAALSMECGPA